MEHELARMQPILANVSGVNLDLLRKTIEDHIAEKCAEEFLKDKGDNDALESYWKDAMQRLPNALAEADSMLAKIKNVTQPLVGLTSRSKLPSELP